MKFIKIKETIVVEGKNDKKKLLSFLNCDIITTNGSDINKQLLNLIKIANDRNGIIIFTDPDYQGKKIRQRIQLFLNNNCKHAFLNIKEAQGPRKKIGIEHASVKAINQSLKNVITFQNNLPSISWPEYYSLKLTSYQNSSQLRKIITDHFDMLYCNGKQLFRRLQMMGTTSEELLNILNKPKQLKQV